MTKTLNGPSVLTATDRCDRCGAQAFIRATLAGGELLFCAHHGRKYAGALADSALLVEDHSEQINERPSPAAF